MQDTASEMWKLKKVAWIEIASIIILTFSLGLYQTDCRLLNGIKLVDVWPT